jgi:small subunit ribosomal protein S20
MANTPSALKRARQTESRTAHNRAGKSRLRTARKAAAEALTKGKDAQAAAVAAVSLAARAAKSGLIHKNAASRIQSRLALAANKATAAK